MSNILIERGICTPDENVASRKALIAIAEHYHLPENLANHKQLAQILTALGIAAIKMFSSVHHHWGERPTTELYGAWEMMILQGLMKMENCGEAPAMTVEQAKEGGELIEKAPTDIQALLQALETEMRKVERAKGEINTTLNRLEHVFGGLHWLEEHHKRLPEGQSVANWIGNIRPSVTYSLDGLTQTLKELEE